MKVIVISNLNLGSFSESCVSFDKLTKKQAEDIAEALNRGLDSFSPIWHIAVDDDYKLYEFKP